MSHTASPIERVESLYLDLVAHYADGEQRETRAAAKLLIIALARLAEHRPDDWERIVGEYAEIVRDQPRELERILDGGRSRKLM